MASGYDVLLQGSPFCDLTFSFTDRDDLPALGQEVFAQEFAINAGGVFNVASTLSGLGLRVGLVCRLGTDIFSRFIAERMEQCGLSLEFTTWVDRPLPVVTAGISFPHDRVFVSYAPPDDRSDPEPQITLDLLEIHQPRALFAYGEHGPAFYRAARERGIFVYIDSHWNLTALHSPHIPDVLAEVDVFSPNLAEACEITGTGTGEEALDALGQWCSCVVIKAGAHGCLAACEGERYGVPAIPVKALETTGAGDNFNAGFLYGRLRSYSFQTCLRCANIAGGLSTLVLGGSGGGVTAADIEDRLVQPAYGKERP